MALWVQRFEGSATTTHATCNPAHHELDPSSGDLINCLLCVDMQERKNQIEHFTIATQCGPGLSRKCRK